jgi:pimeloyl-ACP methyl ester carboxylesterase
MEDHMEKEQERGREAGGFQIGVERFHAEPNMDYTLNRVYAVNGGDLAEIRAAAGRIATLEDWSREFLALASRAREEGRIRHAAAYYRGAHFYLHPADPRKREAYDAYRGLMRGLYAAEFGPGGLAEHRVPFDGAYLPVWRLPPTGAAPAPAPGAASAPIVVMHLGNDSLKEEFLPALAAFRRAGIDFYLFEGPGQGEALYDGGLAMRADWEAPTRAVLDYFDLSGVTLIGLSLGGYLAPRAAAYEPRIERCVAWGPMFDFFEVVVSRRGRGLEGLLRALLKLRAKRALNALISLKLRRDTYTRWGMEHGCFMMGTATPYDYFRKLLDFNLRSCAGRLTQDFLLIGNTADHFIPAGQFHATARGLANVRSFTARIFTAAERAQNHVGFGNAPLVLDYILGWIGAATAERRQAEAAAAGREADHD